MLVDSHCHLNLLDLTAFENKMAGVIEHAHAHQVTTLLTVATDLDQHAQLVALCEQYPGVYMSVGVHPNESRVATITRDILIPKARHSKVVALGETGLDFYRDMSEAAHQKASFIAHIETAKVVKKPLIIHMRHATDETMDILKSESADTVGGVMHCFTEDYSAAKKALDLNFYISFSGIVTFKNATVLKEVAKQVPIDRLLVETDSPYLAPHPYRGKSNLPGFVKLVAEYLADLRGEPFADFAQKTTDNFFRLFSAARN